MSSYVVGRAHFNARIPDGPGRGVRHVVADVAVRAGRRLGYAVRTSEGRRTTVVEARRDHHVMVIVVGDGGRVEVDQVGVADSGCLDRVLALTARMAALGVELRDPGVTTVEGRRGGALIASAARRDDGVLARAVVRERERAVRP